MISPTTVTTLPGSGDGAVMLSFAKKGVYRLGTKTVEMEGGMEVKTVGPDNKLRLLITVA